MKTIKRILLSVVACTITVHAHASASEYASQTLEQMRAFAWNHKGKIAAGIALAGFGYWAYRTYKNLTQKLVTKIEYNGIYNDIVAVNQSVIETKETTTPIVSNKSKTQQQSQPKNSQSNGFDLAAIKESRLEAMRKNQDEQPRLSKVLHLEAVGYDCTCTNKTFRTLEDLTQLKTMNLCYKHRARVMCYALDMSDKMIQSNPEASILFFELFNIQINELKKEVKRLPDHLKRVIVLFDIINSDGISIGQRISYDEEMVQCLKDYLLKK